MSFALLAGAIGTAAAEAIGTGVLVEALGTTGATLATGAMGALGAGAIGSGLGAGVSALMGGDPGKGALMGGIAGLGGGAANTIGGLFSAAGEGAGLTSQIPQIAEQAGTDAASLAKSIPTMTGNLGQDLGALGFTEAPAGSEFALSGVGPATAPAGAEGFVAPGYTKVSPEQFGYTPTYQGITPAQAPAVAQGTPNAGIVSPEFQQARAALDTTPKFMTDAAAQKSPGMMGMLKDNSWMLPAGMMAMPLLSNMIGPNYNVPSQPTYSGPLSKFKYDPSQYTPTTAVPQVYHPSYAGYAGAGYAEGGVTSLTQSSGAPNLDFMDGGSYPMSQQDHMIFNTPKQMPAGAQEIAAQYEVKTNPLTGEPVAKFAHGGIANLAEGGRLLNGVSDDIPAHIDGKQPAKLSEGEFVVPARIVSELGNGSTDAGAKRLYAMMDRIQKQRGKTTGKGKFSVDSKAYRALPA